MNGISKYSKQKKQNTSEDKCGCIAGVPADAGQTDCTDQKADQNAVITGDGASFGQDTAIKRIVYDFSKGFLLPYRMLLTDLGV